MSNKLFPPLSTTESQWYEPGQWWLYLFWSEIINPAIQGRLFLGDLVESWTAAINIIERKDCKEEKNQEWNARRQPKGWSLKSKNSEGLCSYPGHSPPGEPKLNASLLQLISSKNTWQCCHVRKYVSGWSLGGGRICDCKRGAGLLFTDPMWVNCHCCEKSKLKTLTAVSERENWKCLFGWMVAFSSVLSGGLGISVPVI